MGMSAHVAWLRQQGMLESVLDDGPRKSGGSSRLKNHRLAKAEPSRSPPKTEAPARRAVSPQKTSVPARAAAAPSKPLIEVPAHFAAKGPVFADAYREGWSRVHGQMARIMSADAIKGRYGSAMMLCTEDLTDAELLSRLARAPTDRQRAADAVWTRGYAKIAEEKGINTTAAKILVAQRGISPVSAKAQTILANQRAHGGGRSDRDAKADSVWDRAYASISQEPETNPKAANILANQRAFGGGRRSAEETER